MLTVLSHPLFICLYPPILFVTDLMVSDMRMPYRGVSVVISLFMGDLFVFFDASFEINEPMKFGLNWPICKVKSGVCEWGAPDEWQWIHVLTLD